MNKLIALGLLILSFQLASCSETHMNRPNIILIMADDIGFSDLGCYGSEIATPHLDRLAGEGLRFRTFYNMAKCNPTRSTLLTGLYRGGNGAVHIAQLAKNAGYYTIMSGKEHFDKWVPDYCKAENVFDDSFYFPAIAEYFLPPSGAFKNPFYLNGRELKAEDIRHEKSPMYKTDFITDYALNWLDKASGTEQPFFLYLPYHAAHYPLQARPADISKYRGTYLKGWDELRQERFERQQKLSVLPPNAKLSPPEDNLNRYRRPLIPAYTNYKPWNTLTDKQKDSLDLEMAVYAAMIDRLDQNIGRVLKKLEQNGQLKNTLIMFLVDNGACPYYSNEIKEVLPGPANSYWSLRSTWANLCNTPYRQFKQFGLEGGSNTPFIAWWPGVIEPNTITGQPGHVVDIAPTLLDILNIPYPDSIYGYPAIPLHGTSLLPVFEGEARKQPSWFISGTEPFRMFRSGDYKMVRINKGDWELYDLKSDPTELKDLSAEEPEKVERMSVLYQEAVKTLFPTD